MFGLLSLGQWGSGLCTMLQIWPTNYMGKECHTPHNKRLGLRVVWVVFGLELDKVSHQRRNMTVRLHGFYCVWLLDVSQF